MKVPAYSQVTRRSKRDSKLHVLAKLYYRIGISRNTEKGGELLSSSALHISNYIRYTSILVCSLCTWPILNGMKNTETRFQ